MDFLRGGHGYEGTSAFGFMVVCIIFSLYQTRKFPTRKLEKIPQQVFYEDGQTLLAGASKLVWPPSSTGV